MALLLVWDCYVLFFSLSFCLSFIDNYSLFLKNWTVIWILLDVGIFLQPVGIVSGV